MKNILLGIAPLFVFWGVEEKWGTVWGLVAAIVWGVGELGYEWIRFKKVQTITWASTLLVVVFGGLGLLLDNSSLFKFQPVILQVGTALFLIGSIFQEEPFMLKMALKTYPDKFQPGSPLFEIQKKMMKRSTVVLVLVLLIHSAFVGYAAIYSDTRTWIFWKSVGIFIIMVPVFGGFYLWLLLSAKKRR